LDELRDDRRAEGGQVRGGTAGRELAVDDELLVDCLGAREAQVGPQARPGGEPVTADNIGLDERPWTVEPSHDARDLIELMHAVWLAKKIIELVCSGTLAQAAQDYTRELNRASQELRPHSTSRRSPALSTREKQLRAEFMETARLELGFAGEPLLRRTYAEDDLPDVSTSTAFQS